MATLQPRDITDSLNARRRGHVTQISISDDNHHVTEAIGTLYGDNDYHRNESRPLSFTPTSPEEESATFTSNRYDPSSSFYHQQSTSESPLARSLSSERYNRSMNGTIQSPPTRQSSLGSNHGGGSPTQPAGNTANQAFPLNDIDYESSPAAVQQELSNLQAIRRMSMNVDAADPDLPSFSPNYPVPSIPSTPSADEDDTSRLFWVPARLHPELAPKEFKTFVEERVDKIRRRSGDENSLSPDGSDPARRSSSKLNRRKSMLSKTISSGFEYQDGADVLERKRSKSSQIAIEQNETTLQELEELVNDPSSLVRTLSIESSRQSLEYGSERTSTDDTPILPTTPTGQSLKRSTRTNYRRGSLREGKRVTPSRRAIGRIADGDHDEASGRPSLSDETNIQPITRVQTEPMPSTPSSTPSENYSRPHRRAGLGFEAGAPESSGESAQPPRPSQDAESEQHRPVPTTFKSRIASNGRTTAPIPGYERPQSVSHTTETSHSTHDNRQTLPATFNYQYPERKSSHEFSRTTNSMQTTPIERPPMRSGYGRQAQQTQTLDDVANSPSLMPGLSTRTDILSVIPTFSEDQKRPNEGQKKKKEKDPSEKKSSWGWLLGSEDRESSKKSKSKSSKNSDKSSAKEQPLPHDNTRLDVLQTAVEPVTRGRESLVLDRESVRIDEDRKRDFKKSHDREERGSGLFSSLFGGSKKKNITERESSGRKANHATRLSPEQPARILRADIDYNWTRFSILEERAIYRMAHMKLANPRRALYSQVLLSNFMYSYLAKVQQMHPQIQIPQFVTQKQQQSQQQSNQDDQTQPSEEFTQWQRYQEQHQPATSDAPVSGDGNAGYIDDYDPGHQQQEDLSRLQYYPQANGIGNVNQHMGAHDNSENAYLGDDREDDRGGGGGGGGGGANAYGYRHRQISASSPSTNWDDGEEDREYNDNMW